MVSNMQNIADLTEYHSCGIRIYVYGKYFLTLQLKFMCVYDIRMLMITGKAVWFCDDDYECWGVLLVISAAQFVFQSLLAISFKSSWLCRIIC